MSGVILRVDRVSKSFSAADGHSTLPVLENIDLEIEQGEFVSLVGPSGCGKTTLLRMMVGLTACDEGEIVLRDQRVKGIPDNIGFVFQEPALLPWRSVYDNIDLALSAKRWPKETRKTEVNRYLEMVGLSAFASYPPYQLSGGMQRRVAMARGLVGAPDILFMDEPFVALDAMTRHKVQTDLARIVAETGTTCVFITHDVEESLFLSDRVVVLSPGPGRVQDVILIDQPRPRQMTEFLTDPAVNELRARILWLIEGAEMTEAL
jgi:NitT/TauT family transport system ATP-binding protein